MNDPTHDDGPKPYTFAQAAELTGLSVDALRKRVARKRLRASPSNEDDLLRVWLSEADIRRARTGQVQDADQSPGFSEGEVAGLREALAREQERADQAEVRAERERERAGQAEQARERAEGREGQVRDVADRRGAELAEVRERAGRAEGEVKALREALEDARRPGWRRWLGM